MMQHVVLSKVNKAVAWGSGRQLFEFPGKFPQSYSDLIYDDNMNKKKTNIKLSPEDREDLTLKLVVNRTNPRSQFPLSSFIFRSSVMISMLQNARN